MTRQDPELDSRVVSVLVLVLVGLGVWVGSGPLGDNSFLTHLATERRIVDGGVPRADPYTFTVAGRPWVVFSWLASWWFATLERHLGADAIRVFGAITHGAAVGLVVVLAGGMRRRVTGMAMVVITVAASLRWWGERPQTMGYVGFASLLAVVVWVDRRLPLGVWGWVPVVAMVPLGALWVNVHGTWMAGLGVAGAVASILWLASERGPGRVLVFVPVVAAAVGILLGALASPYGLDLPVASFRLLGRPGLHRVREWGPVHWWSLDGLGLAAVVGGTVTGLLGGVRAARTSHRSAPGVAAGVVPLVAAAVLVLAGGFGASRSQRLVPLVLVLGVTMAGRFLGRVDDGRGSSAGVKPRSVLGSAGSGRGWTGGWQPAAMLVAVACVAAVHVTVQPTYDLRSYPIGLVDRLGDPRSDPPVRVLAPDYVGNYLEWVGWTGSVFVDDRVEVMDPVVSHTYGLILAGDPSTLPELDKSPVQRVIWPEADPFTRLMSHRKGWCEGRSPDVGWVVFDRCAA